MSLIKDEKLGDQIHEFILKPVNVFMFLLALLISSGIFPRLPPKVSLNDGSFACRKDVCNVIAKIIRNSLTTLS